MKKYLLIIASAFLTSIAFAQTNTEEVDLIQIEVVGLQPPQRRLDGADHVLPAGAAIPRIRAHRCPELARQDHVLAAVARRHPPTDDLLGDAGQLAVVAVRIHVGGVDERDPRIEGGVEDVDRRRFVTLEAERHRAETER